MRAVVVMLCAAGCFHPDPLGGQSCVDWCPPPETCVAGVCRGGTSGDGGGSNVPVDGNYMFVTSEKRTAVEINGFAGADAWCQQLATARGLPGTYVAWTTRTYDRIFGRAPRGWYRVDGKPFADTLDDFATNGKILYPPRLTEYGADLVQIDDVIVGTGTFDGRDDIIGGDCAGLTVSTGDMIAGFLDGGVGQWMAGTQVPCSERVRMYCFGIDKQVEVKATPPASYRDAFVTKMGQPVGPQLAALDARCDTEAAQVGLPAGFKAWVATTTGSAQSRFPAGPDWKRPDHVVALSGDGMKFSAPINVDVAGGYHSGSAWTGAATPNLTATNAATQTCNNWTSNSGSVTGYVGMTSRGRIPEAFGLNVSPAPCTNTLYVYCLHP